MAVKQPVQQVRITANLQAKVRYDTLNSKSYMVVPVVMLTQGVHEGSQGKLFYPEEELAKTPATWNTRPVVIYHPKSGAAGEKDVLETQGVGMLMNTTYDFETHRLKAEAWLEKSRLEDTDERVLNALDEGKVVEVSTGLFTDNEQKPGKFGEEAYDAIARNYRPDHLAILPDQKGACSVADGAGLLRNSAADKGAAMYAFLKAALILNETSHDDLRCRLGELLPKGKQGSDDRAYSCGWVQDVYDTFFVYSNAGKLYKQGYSKDGDTVSLDGSPAEVIRTTQYKTLDGALVGNQNAKERRMDVKAVVGKIIANEGNQFTEDDRPFLEGMSEGHLEKMAGMAANAKAAEPDDEEEDDKKGGKGKGGAGCCKNSVVDSVDDEKTAAAIARAKAEENGGATATKAGPRCEKCGCTCEKGAACCNKCGKPVGNATPTVNEYINNAPEAIREVLTNGLQAHKAEKDRLIAVITANTACEMKSEFLAQKGIQELRMLAKLAAANQPQQTAGALNFSGMGEPGEPVGNAAQEALVMPAMNFSTADVE